MIGTDKKMVFINGSLRLPLQTGAPAVIDYNREALSTSPVMAIQKVDAAVIIFETRESVYHVSQRHTSAPATMICRIPGVA